MLVTSTLRASAHTPAAAVNERWVLERVATPVADTTRPLAVWRSSQDGALAIEGDSVAERAAAARKRGSLIA